ncbi:MAG: HalOD1 output domain-containing protein [Halohasta sp.]
MVPDIDLSVRIPNQLAALHGVDPTELSPPVGEVVDLEALERTVSSAVSAERSATTTITFEYGSFTVTVEASEGVDVTVVPTARHRARSPSTSVAN